METWRRFVRLDRIDQMIVLQSAAALIATSIALRINGLGRWKTMLERLSLAASAKPLRGSQTQIPHEFINRIVRMQAAVERRLFFRANCLEHSLVLSWLLRRRGIPVDVRIGGCKHNDRFEAHAWVELDGKPLADSNENMAHFSPFDSLPSMERQAH
jgi:hypothetical protein